MGKEPAAVAVDARGVLKGHGVMLGKCSHVLTLAKRMHDLIFFRQKSSSFDHLLSKDLNSWTGAVWFLVDFNTRS